MGKATLPHKMTLIAGLISNDTGLFETATRALERRFGEVDLESAVLEFHHTSYYNREMGEGLKRKFLSFRRLVRPETIYTVKLTTNSLERRFSDSGRRRINIDPGYVDLSKLVLLSTKDYFHRIYLGKGIFAEVTLFYRDRTFNPWPWTYPDYRTDEYIEFFNAVRELYRMKNLPLPKHA